MGPTTSKIILPLIVAFVSLARGLSSFDEWPHQRVALDDVSIHFRYYGNGPPIFLIHGFPEHSMTWDTVGPILAQNYTVICPDNRGMGDSSVPYSYNFTAAAAAEDILAVVDFLNLNSTYLAGHDKGVGIAAAMVAKRRSLVKRYIAVDYPMPGYGYEMYSAPTPEFNLYSNWQLGFFSIADAAQFFIQGRERQMLSWYFFHTSYSGGASFSNEKLYRYASTLAKPGFLRAGLSYFSNQVVAQDAAFFKGTIGTNKMQQPVLAMSGEVTGYPALLRHQWSPLAANLEVDVVPKAGHWIADENPVWLANRMLQFLANDSGIASVNLDYLANQVSLHAPVI